MNYCSHCGNRLTSKKSEYNADLDFGFKIREGTQFDGRENRKMFYLWRGATMVKYSEDIKELYEIAADKIARLIKAKKKG